jgi:hypothetical protein
MTSYEEFKQKRLNGDSLVILNGYFLEGSDRELHGRAMMPFVGCYCVQDSPDSPCPCSNNIFWIFSDLVKSKRPLPRQSLDGISLIEIKIPSNTEIRTESWNAVNSSDVEELIRHQCKSQCSDSPMEICQNQAEVYDSCERHKSDFDSIFDEINSTSKHPAFRSLIREIFHTPDREKINKIVDLFSIDEMVKRGIPLPEGTEVEIDRNGQLDIGVPQSGTTAGKKTVVDDIDVCIGWSAPYGTFSIRKCWKMKVEIEIPWLPES